MVCSNLRSEMYLPLVVFFSIFFAMHCGANEVAFTATVQEIRGLSPADQKTLIASAFENRLVAARNVEFSALTRIQNHEYKTGKVGALLAQLNGGRYHHWQFGNTSRTDMERGGPDVVKPTQFVVAGFDRTVGAGRTTIHFSDNPRKFGRIDVVHDPLTEENRYVYWLDGKHNRMAEYLFRYLVDHRDSFTVRIPDNQDVVYLTVPWRPVWSDRELGTREFSLDPSKGFLPVKGKSRWQKLKSNGELAWRSEEFVVEDARVVGNVWMPTKLYELIGASTLGPDKITVLETEVSSIRSGTVTAKDVEVPFDSGMQVVDAIRGVTYKIGTDGKLSGAEKRLVGARPERNLPAGIANGRSVLRSVFLLVNILALAVLAIVAGRRIIAKRRTA